MSKNTGGKSNTSTSSGTSSTPGKTTPKNFKMKFFGTRPDVLVVIDFEDLQRYRYLVDQVAPNEVQWYAKVDREIVPASDRAQWHKNDLYMYIISDMFVPEQEVSRTQVDTDVRRDPMKMYRLMQEIQSRHADDSEIGFNEEAASADINKMHAWCHSHPFSGNPGPSGTDDNQFEEWVQENQIQQGVQTPMVALIFGNGEKIHARLYDPFIPGVFYDDVLVHIDMPHDFDTSYIDNAIENKIAVRSYGNPRHIGFGGGAFVKGSDGVYRSPVDAAKFEEKEQEGKLVNAEAAASEFFSKRIEDWEQLLFSINSTKDNQKKVAELWQEMNRWLHTPSERTMFVLGLTEEPEVLVVLADEDQGDLALIGQDDALEALQHHCGVDIITSVQIKAALTFAKRYVKQENASGRTRAVGALAKKMEEADPAWGWVNMPPEPPPTPTGYQFIADDDDDGVLVPYSSGGSTHGQRRDL